MVKGHLLTNIDLPGLAYEKIKQRVLYLQVLDYDRFSRNDPIGEILLPLHTVNLGEEILHNIPLQPCKGSVSNLSNDL